MWGPVAETLIFHVFFSLCGGPVAGTLIFTISPVFEGPVVGDFEFSRKKTLYGVVPSTGDLSFFGPNSRVWGLE